MTKRAEGTFTVAMKPLGEMDSGNTTKMARLSIDKKYEGDLVGTGTGEMMSAVSPFKGSAGYVALERFVGTLRGRRGSFVLQHSGTMNRGAAGLVITIVADSGTEELTGISGSYDIQIEAGRHSYTLDYVLPADAPGSDAP